MREILTDSNTYSLTIRDPTTKTNNKHNKLINKLYIEKIIDKILRNKLICHNPITPRIYGLPKIHKPNAPLRPIVSTIGSTSYQLSKYLISILKNITSNNEYNTKNSYELAEQLNEIQLGENDIFCSFDVIALYTNIPTDLVINEIVLRWDEIKEFTNMQKSSFIELLTFCIKENNFFKFEGVIYKQTKGLAMGNPLSPVLADIVMTKLFKTCLPKINTQPTLIKKYVDDILIIATEETIDQIHHHFSNFNCNIQFTIEREKENCLPFLDILLIRNENKIITNWYTKPTSSNRMLNFLSHHPKRMKINIAYSFIKKVLKLSNQKFHSKNKETITHILIKNNYPKFIIKSLFRKYINDQHNQNNSTTSNNPKTYFKTITYIPTITENIINTIRRNNQNINIAYKIKNKMQHVYSKLKDPITQEQNQNIVYSIPCNSCNKIYIGQTKRWLAKRIHEHKLSIKNQHITKEKTAVVTHYQDTGHTLNFEETKIIDREEHLQKRLILEACHIWKNGDNTINFRTDLNNINSIYINIINTLNKN